MTFKKRINNDKLGRSSRKVTGRELTYSEEIGARLDTLIELLQEKGIINKKEYDSRVAMNLHEISKATAFQEMDEEL
jgi:predicted transcriptional regulator YheO